MDERSAVAAERATERHLKEAYDRLHAVKTYTVIVVGWNNNQPLEPIEAIDADERSAAMDERGIKLSKDPWAAGYVDRHGALQICGRSDEAKRLVERHLRKKR